MVAPWILLTPVMNPDQNANGDPTDAGENDPTIDNINQDPQIGAAKLSSGFTDNGDGTYTLTYTVEVENLGTVVPLGDVQVFDDLVAAGYGTHQPGGVGALAPGEYTISSAPSMVLNSVDGLTPNTSYNGSADTRLFLTISGGTLDPGERAVVEFEVTVFPDLANGTFDVSNQATARADAPANDDDTGIADDDNTSDTADRSDNGDETDPNNNGNPDEAGENDPTPDSIEITSIIGAAKTSSGFTNNEDGTFDITYTFTVENLGNTRLHDVNVRDDLTAAIFGTHEPGGSAALDAGEYTIISGPTIIDNVPAPGTLSVLGSYNGTAPDRNILNTVAGGYLDPGESIIIEMTIRIFPDFAGGTSYTVDNQAFAFADAPNNDTPTGTQDNNPSDADTRDDTDDDAVDANGNGDPTEDQDDEPTIDNITIDPQIGVAKASSGFTDNLNGTYTITYTVTVENLGTTVDLGDVVVLDELETNYGTHEPGGVGDLDEGEYTISGAPTIINNSLDPLFANPAYNGTTFGQALINPTLGGVMQPGEIVIIEYEVTVFPDLSNGTFAVTNQAWAFADAPDQDDPVGTGDFNGGDASTDDFSDNGIVTDPNNNGDPTEAGENDPTPDEIIIESVVGAAKASSGFTNNGDGTYTITYTYEIENFGNTRLGDISLTDDLVAANFGAYEPANTLAELDEGEYIISGAPLILNNSADGLAPNNNFTGTGSDDDLLDFGVGTIEPGEVVVVQVEITIFPDFVSGTYTTTNSAFVYGDAPNQTDGLGPDISTQDVSDAGDEPDQNANGDPTDAGENDPTIDNINQDPQIGAAKLSSGFTDNGDGTYTITYTVEVENLGTVVPLGDVQVRDNLVAAGYGTHQPGGVGSLVAGEYTISGAPSIVVNSNDGLTPNSDYNGSGDTRLFLTEDGGTMDPGESVIVEFEITVFPDLDNGTFDVSNQATAGADAPANDDDTGTADDDISNADTDDLSDNGTETDENNNGNPEEDGENDPTPDSIEIISIIGAAKTSSGFTNNEDGTFDITYTYVVENLGNTRLHDVQLYDDLELANFGVIDMGAPFEAGEYQIIAAPSIIANVAAPGTLTANSSYTGMPMSGGNAQLFNTAAGGYLEPGETVTLTLTIRIFPDFAGVTDYQVTNRAFAFADAPNLNTPTGTSDGTPADASTTDNSDDDAVDENGDGNPNQPQENEPTVDNISIDPQIGVAKASNGFTDNGNGTYTLTYTITVENLGTTVDLGDVQVFDNLVAAGYGTYDGGTLDEGEYQITAGPSIINNSTNGLTPNTAFDGSSDTRLFLTEDGGVMEPGEIVVLEVEVTVFPDLSNGTFMVDNQAFAFADAPDNDDADGIADDDMTADTDDASDNGTITDDNNNGNPDEAGENDSTPDEIEIISVVGAAKASSGFTNNGDGTYTITYTYEIENFGNTRLGDISLTDNLPGANFGMYEPANTLAELDEGEYIITGAPTIVNNSNDPLTANAAFTGTASELDLLDLTSGGTMEPGEVVVVEVEIRIFPDFVSGTYTTTNSALVSADAPNQTEGVTADGSTTDISDAGDEPDQNANGNPNEAGENDATIDNIVQDPQIGAAKLSSGFTDNGDGTYTLTYTVEVENLGTVVPLGDVQVFDNLVAAGYGLFNPIATVKEDLNEGEYFVSDAPSIVINSIDGLTPNPDYDGDADSRLFLTIDGGTMDPGERVIVEFEVTVFPDLSNGTFDVSNQATARADAPANDEDTGTADDDNTSDTSDLSDNGDETDPNNNGNPDEAGENDPTPDSIEIISIIGAAKTSNGFTNNEDGTFDITYTFEVENLGNTRLHDVQLRDDLMAANFGSYVPGAPAVGEYTILNGPVITSNVVPPLFTNNFYNGESSTTLLATSFGGYLDPGESITIQLTVRIFPDFAGGTTYTVDNQALAFADAPNNDTPTGTTDNNPGDADTKDLTDDEEVDENNNGDPTEATDNEPTIDNITIDPQIGVAKASSGFTDNLDGTYTLNYTITVENLGTTIDLGDVQVFDDLVGAGYGIYDGGTLDEGEYQISAVPSITNNSTDPLTPNAGFDGSADTRLFLTDQGGVMEPGEIVVLEVEVTVFPDLSNGTFMVDNQAFAFADAPDNDDADGIADDDMTADTDDASDNGTITDDNNNGNPDEAGENDSTPDEIEIISVVGAAKASSGFTNNGDGTYTITYTYEIENFGNTRLGDISLTDNLPGANFGMYEPANTLAELDEGEYIITGAPTIVNNSNDPLTANAAFTGTAPELDLLDLTSGGTMEPGEVVVVEVEIRIFPDFVSGTYTTTNSALVSADAPNQTEGVTADGSTTDISDAGDEPDQNANGNPNEAGENDATIDNIVQDPQIGAAKLSSGFTDNGDGTYTLTYTVEVENLGTVVPLGDVQVFDNLVAAGYGLFNPIATVKEDLNEGEYFVSDAPSIVINSIDGLTPNPDYDGDADSRLFLTIDGGTMDPGERVIVEFEVTVFPDLANGTFDVSNQATARADAPANDEDTGTADDDNTSDTSDLSDNGDETDPNNNGNPDEAGENDPTPDSIEIISIIGASKTSSGFTNNEDGTFDITYTFEVENLGNTRLHDVQVKDDLVAANFGMFDLGGTFDEGEYQILNGPSIIANVVPALSANGSYNGDGNITLLNTAAGGYLDPGESITIQLTVRIFPDFMNGTTYMVDNQALAFADAPNDDDPVTVADDTEGDAGTTDLSDDEEVDENGDGNPDEPQENESTIDNITIDPQIGIAKSSNGFTDNLDGTYTITYTLTLENLGTTVDLGDVQVRDNLVAAGFGLHNPSAAVKEDLNEGEYFISGLPTILNNSTDPLTPSNLFTGSPGNLVLFFVGQGGVMEPGEVVVLEYEVTVFPDLSNGTFSVVNQANAFADAPDKDDPVGVADNNSSDADTEDLSDNGNQVDENSNGDPSDPGEDDPTPDDIIIESVIGGAKASSGFTNNGDGTYTITYSFEIENFGNTRLGDISMIDDLTTATGANFGSFEPANTLAELDEGEYIITGAPMIVNNSLDALTPNANFNGDSDQELFDVGVGTMEPGEVVVVEVEIRIFPDFVTGTYTTTNSATVFGDAPNDTDGTSDGNTQDVTDAGDEPDQNDDEDPTDVGENDPTIDNIVQDPQIGAAKLSSGFTDNGDGTYTINYTIEVENLGTVVPLGDVQVRDDLVAAGYGLFNPTANG
jgi:hypothetical protein